ncbi:hypothetical protein WH47_01286, partial [Habropoda laboriosa]
LENLREAIAVKRPGLLNQYTVIFHHKPEQMLRETKQMNFYSDTVLILPKRWEKIVEPEDRYILSQHLKVCLKR